MIAGAPQKQFEWHETFRDQAKNMYRTSYSDMSHFRECHVKSDYPSGYGGHVPSVRHDILHRNTAIDRNIALRRADPSRDSLPSFCDQLSGLPSFTKYPNGAHNNPTKGVVPHDGTTTMLKPPWGRLLGPHEGLNQRHVPPTMRKSCSMPQFTGHRTNEAGQTAGMMLSRSKTPPQAQPPATLTPHERLRRTVHVANEDAQQGYFPTEAEILEQQMQGLA